MKSRNALYILFVIGIVLSAWAWFEFSYPRFSTIDLSVSRSEAVEIASKYLQVHEKIDPSKYLQSVIFSFDIPGDRFLQKAIGFKPLVGFEEGLKKTVEYFQEKYGK